MTTIMKDPTDLDIFEGLQADLTRKVEERGKLGRLALLGNAMNKCSVIAIIAMTDMPLPIWQRAAFEAHQQAESSGKVIDRGYAAILWAHVKFLQENQALADEYLNSQAARDELEELGINFGHIPDGDRD